MSTHKLTAALSIFAVNFGCLAAGPNLGKSIDTAEIAAWDIGILPDGTVVGMSGHVTVVAPEDDNANHGDRAAS